MSNYNETEYQPEVISNETEYHPEVISEHEAYSFFDDMLDDCYGDVEVAGYTYRASELLKAVDPVVYREEFLGYVDSMREEFTVEGY